MELLSRKPYQVSFGNRVNLGSSQVVILGCNPSSCSNVDYMNLKLHFIRRDFDYYSSKRFSFAVVDLDRSNSYPLNFVCMLPLKLENGKADNCFEKHFGNKSLEQAKALLNRALNSADDSEVKGELKRRIKLLEPKQLTVNCSGCTKLFHPRKIRKFNFCAECMEKKFGKPNFCR